MNQYLICAYDYTDQDALTRRMNTRADHLAGARRLKASGNFVVAGAMLDDSGKMIGSTMVVQFEDKSELQAWLDDEPYILNKVWEKVDVKPFRVADV
jgi:uncharacterized protein